MVGGWPGEPEHVPCGELLWPVWWAWWRCRHASSAPCSSVARCQGRKGGARSKSAHNRKRWTAGKAILRGRQWRPRRRRDCTRDHAWPVHTCQQAAHTTHCALCLASVLVLSREQARTPMQKKVLRGPNLPHQVTVRHMLATHAYTASHTALCSTWSRTWGATPPLGAKKWRREGLDARGSAGAEERDKRMARGRPCCGQRQYAGGQRQYAVSSMRAPRQLVLSREEWMAAVGHGRRATGGGGGGQERVVEGWDTLPLPAPKGIRQCDEMTGPGGGRMYPPSGAAEIDGRGTRDAGEEIGGDSADNALAACALSMHGGRGLLYFCNPYVSPSSFRCALSPPSPSPPLLLSPSPPPPLSPLPLPIMPCVSPRRATSRCTTTAMLGTVCRCWETRNARLGRRSRSLYSWGTRALSCYAAQSGRWTPRCSTRSIISKCGWTPSTRRCRSSRRRLGCTLPTRLSSRSTSRSSMRCLCVCVVLCSRRLRVVGVLVRGEREVLMCIIV